MSSSDAPSTRRVFVIGVGMTKFTRPPSIVDYDVLGAQALRDALNDANIDYKLVESAVAGYCYGDPTCGQRTIYHLGLTGIPIVNVNNNCSTGSTSLYLARQQILAGVQCVAAVAFEKMEKGNLTQKFEKSHASPSERHFAHMYQLGADKTKISPHMNQFTEDVLKLFANAQQEHMNKYGSKDQDYCMIAYKNHRQSQYNDRACMSKIIPYETIANSPYLAKPIRVTQACPTAVGAAAAILCSESFVNKYSLYDSAIEIVGQALMTDLPSSFETSYIQLSGYGLAKQATARVLSSAHLIPADVDVIECHNCFSANELFMYEALGLCSEGSGSSVVASGEWRKNTSGGELFVMRGSTGKHVVVNPSGGLECKGHPIGATGVAQCYELVTQLRGQAGKRQVDGAKVALQHNFGIGSAAVVTCYRKPQWSSKL